MRTKSYRMWISLAFIATVMDGGMACAGEIIQGTVTERKVAALPKGPEIKGTLPRPLLMVNLKERGKFPGDRSVSSFWVFDPATPDQGLHKIFSGPGDNQHLRFITPLYGGYGVATGQWDQEKEPKTSVPWTWFNPLDGTSGPTIDIDIWNPKIDGNWFVGEQIEHRKDGGSIRRIIRYDPLKAVVQTTEVEFPYVTWPDESNVLGVARLKEGERVVRMDVKKSEYEVIGMPPTAYNSKADGMYGFKILPAGENCCDGIYAIDGFSLWFMPKRGRWHSVIRDVQIVKTFGGAPPRLPVCYLGNGRFAVAKTVKDEVEVPKTTSKEDDGFGAAEAVTMLIDGITGEVLKQSKPFIYNHNPNPETPDDWWAADMKPKPPAPEIKVKTLFQWNAKKREIRFSGDQVVNLHEDDDLNVSPDGRYLTIYQKSPRGGGKAKTKILFRIIDGKTGQNYSFELASDFYGAWVEVSWPLLCSESPPPKTLENYRDYGPELE